MDIAMSAKKAHKMFPCVHCGESFPYPPFYCSTCKMHTHTTFRYREGDKCVHCHFVEYNARMGKSGGE